MNCSHPIPDEFASICDDKILNLWDENEPEKFIRFWSWFDEGECVDLETEDITAAILRDYNQGLLNLCLILQIARLVG